ncbi:hypothetical protein MTR_7g055580 [Medicago truncatula]|uniref:Uncharacterized protein n=1 Tax=Medicago truncatula TaxID=3880 RepID=G7L047_MEDTR|nr:hypothetical protein MTR_7g055580 [Medicago truncatula]
MEEVIIIKPEYFLYPRCNMWCLSKVTHRCIFGSLTGSESGKRSILEEGYSGPLNEILLPLTHIHDSEVVEMFNPTHTKLHIMS